MFMLLSIPAPYTAKASSVAALAFSFRATNGPRMLTPVILDPPRTTHPRSQRPPPPPDPLSLPPFSSITTSRILDSASSTSFEAAMELADRRSITDFTMRSCFPPTSASLPSTSRSRRTKFKNFPPPRTIKSSSKLQSEPAAEENHAPFSATRGAVNLAPNSAARVSVGARRLEGTRGPAKSRTSARTMRMWPSSDNASAMRSPLAALRYT
mmetsp:Transcript_10175/g.27160  ORF Transcript_10175/g.27160 Transcript_10175/m.27160 type:complete len:211 (-) Transcript_10175:368-1000(-)